MRVFLRISKGELSGMEEQTIFNILHNMDKVTNTLIIQWNKIFDEDLGISHVLVLGHIKINGPTRPSDLAKMLGLTPPTLTHLSEKLVRRGLAKRIASEKDRRMIYLDITEEGENVIDRANLKGHALRKKIFSSLTEEEKTQLLHIYEKLNEALVKG